MQPSYQKSVANSDFHQHIEINM